MGIWGYVAGALILAGLLWTLRPRRPRRECTQASNGLWVETVDPMMAEVVSRAMESGNAVFAQRDDEGNMTFSEEPLPTDDDSLT